MSTIDDLEERNAVFAREAFSPKDSLMPALKTIVISCVDPRVDPAHVLGLGDGEAVVIRNVGGRVNPAAIETLAMLGAVARGAGTPPGPGWNLIVLQHTDCGITRLPAADPMLASYFRVPAENLENLAIADPYRAVAVDVAEVGRYPLPPFSATGLVYDVTTGLVHRVPSGAVLASCGGAWRWPARGAAPAIGTAT